MSPAAQKVLERLGESGGCLCFAPIARDTNQDRATVRRACRYLARRGLAEFHKGLWTEDGDPYGAGYCITDAGRAALLAGRRCPPSPADIPSTQGNTPSSPEETEASQGAGQ